MYHMKENIVYLSKKLTFSAAHRLNSKHLSAEENEKAFGKCNRTHGHNYTVKVTCRGAVDPKLGYFMNAATLKINMQKAIDDVLDHRNLDIDIEFFKEHVSTMENLAVFIWNSMKSIMDEPKLLYEVKVKETDSSTVSYRGEENVYPP